MNTKAKEALKKAADGETLTDEERQTLADYYNAIREDVARRQPSSEVRDLRRAGIG
jgi:hypothetical protein